MSPAPECSLTDLLAQSVLRNPGAPAVIGPEETLTYAQLDAEARRIAAGVAQRSRAPVTALYMPMCPAFASAFFGVLHAGRAALPLNLMLPVAELNAIVKDAGADLAVTTSELKPRLAGLSIPVVTVDELPPGPGGAVAAPKAGDLCVLLYTSGTTGQPKGVELTHGNLVSNALNSATVMGFGPQNRVLACLPTFHTYALTATLLAPLAAGGAVVTLPRFEPELVLQTASQQRCDVLIMVPSMFRILTRRQERSRVPLANLKLAIAGGEPLPAEAREHFEKVFGIPLFEGYGQTETSPIIAFNLPSAHRPGTVGRPLPGYHVKIVDPDTLAELPTGQTGEVWTEGPHVMRGYHNRPAETAHVLEPGGWLRTGDMGCLDAEGYLKITGRLREIIKVAGEMVFPAEVENVLLKHAAVCEAGVIGVPDERHGESVKAFVALLPGKTATAEELIAHCRELLPGYKVPRTIEFRKELPKTLTGKVLRRALA